MPAVVRAVTDVVFSIERREMGPVESVCAPVLSSAELDFIVNPPHPRTAAGRVWNTYIVNILLIDRTYTLIRPSFGRLSESTTPPETFQLLTIGRLASSEALVGIRRVDDDCALPR